MNLKIKDLIGKNESDKKEQMNILFSPTWTFLNKFLQKNAIQTPVAIGKISRGDKSIWPAIYVNAMEFIMLVNLAQFCLHTKWKLQ